MLKRKLLIKFLIILPLFAQLAKVECRNETSKKGRGKAFGAGILAGGLAGVAMGHILTRANSPAEVHHHHFAETNAAPSNTNVPAAIPQLIPPPPPAPPRPYITIERGETLANGCYKQIVKEPSVYDAMTFVETEQLICPPEVSLPIVPIVPAQSIAHIQTADITGNVATSNNVQPPQAPDAIPTNIANTNANIAESNHAVPPQAPASLPTNIEPGYNIPPQPPRFIHDGASLEPLLPQPLPQPPVQNPSIPVQVITLSKKTGFYEDENKKKNSANNVLAVNFVFILLIAAHVCMF